MTTRTLDEVREALAALTKPCPSCNGLGTIRWPGNAECDYCLGTGRVFVLDDSVREHRHVVGASCLPGCKGWKASHDFGTWYDAALLYCGSVRGSIVGLQVVMEVADAVGTGASAAEALTHALEKTLLKEKP